MDNSSLFKKSNLQSPDFAGKVAAGVALAGAGWYLHNQNKDLIEEQESGAESWTLFKNRAVMLVIWFVVVVLLVLVWQYLCEVAKLDRSTVDMLMVSLFVLMFCSVISYTSGRISTTKYIVGAMTLVSLASTVFLWKEKKTRNSAIVMAGITAWFGYRVAALNSIDGPKSDESSRIRSADERRPVASY
jgi:hypothetical protein